MQRAILQISTVLCLLVQLFRLSFGRQRHEPTV
jgi:hypothetical protein